MFNPRSRTWQPPRFPTSLSSTVITASNGQRYKLSHKLGAGAFAKVFEAHDTAGNSYAVKIESATKPYPSLPTEREVYRHVAPRAPGCVPRMHYFGTHGHDNVLVMDCLGPSLAKQVDDSGKPFSEKSVCMIAVKLIKALNILHHAGFIHRDIKPDNILRGRIDPENIYLADFGLAGEFRDRWTHAHIPPRHDVGTVGTVEFSSPNSMNGVELSRRDDMVSLGYTLIYLFKGALPWSHLKAHSLQSLQRKVREYKFNTSDRELCRDLPKEMLYYMDYVRHLKFNQRPDYAKLAEYFRSALHRRGYKMDGVFEEWMHPSIFSDVTDESPASSQDSNGSSSRSPDRGLVKRYSLPLESDRLYSPRRDDGARLVRKFTERSPRRHYNDKERDRARDREKDKERDRDRSRRRTDKPARKAPVVRIGRKAADKDKEKDKLRRKSTAKDPRRRTAKDDDLRRRPSPRDRDRDRDRDAVPTRKHSPRDRRGHKR